MTRELRLRAAAIDKLTAATGVRGLNRRQQAELIGVNYHAFWRLLNGGKRAASRTIADVMAGTAAFADRYGCERPSFEELFEIREQGKPTAAIAA